MQIEIEMPAGNFEPQGADQPLGILEPKGIEQAARGDAEGADSQPHRQVGALHLGQKRLRRRVPRRGRAHTAERPGADGGASTVEPRGHGRRSLVGSRQPHRIGGEDHKVPFRAGGGRQVEMQQAPVAPCVATGQPPDLPAERHHRRPRRGRLGPGVASDGMARPEGRGAERPRHGHRAEVEHPLRQRRQLGAMTREQRGGGGEKHLQESGPAACRQPLDQRGQGA